MVAPNRFSVWLSAEDAERFAGFMDAIAARAAGRGARARRDENYHFIGPVEVLIGVDERRKRGDMKVVAEIVEAEGGQIGSIVFPDGRRVRLGQETAMIGRLPECAVPLSDPQVSRHHAEVRPDHDGYRVVDLGSMNGTLVNGTRISEHVLRDGDEIVIGATTLRYEES